jgi:hypothetical protein
MAVLFDQQGIQKVIDRLTAVKPLLPEAVPVKSDGEPKAS